MLTPQSTKRRQRIPGTGKRIHQWTTVTATRSTECPIATSCQPLMRFFFFQAEDGIRDYKVTGVQTCALPICRAASILRGVDGSALWICTTVTWGRLKVLASATSFRRSNCSCTTGVTWLSIDRKSTRLNSSHLVISYAVFCLKKKKKQKQNLHFVNKK